MYENKKVSVLGAGISGLSAVDFFINRNCSIFVSSSSEIPHETALKLKERGVEFEDGVNSLRVLDCDILFLSPGVPRSSNIILQAIEKNIEIINDIEILFNILPNKKFVAITGSNGKTTTTSLVGHIFSKSAKTWVAGNIGTPALDIFKEKNVAEYEFIVLELSSFQLETVNKFSPFVSAILNITPDHLDRYNSFDDYKNAKFRIFANQTNEQYIVLNKDDKNLNSVRCDCKKLFFSSTSTDADVYFSDNTIYENGEKLISLGEVVIKGRHNAENIMAAYLCAKVALINKNNILEAIKSFQGAEHRLEFVAEVNGVAFYNDSKATNPDSVKAALESFSGKNILWLAGGRDKNTPLDSLFGPAKNSVKKAIFFGEANEKFQSHFENLVDCKTVATLENAVKESLKYAAKGDIVLLSPGCTSFDAYKSYIHRGHHFKKLIMELKNG